MTTAYITKEAGKIKAKNNTFLFEGIDGTKTTLFPEKLERVILSGNIGITGAALSLAATSSIDIFLLKGRKVLGIHSSEFSKDCLTRHKQHVLMEDEEWVMNTAKTIVRGKIVNEKHFVQRLARSNKIDRVFGKKVSGYLDDLLGKLLMQSSLDNIRGIEGAAAEVYFSVFGLNFKPDWITFTNRENVLQRMQ